MLKTEFDRVLTKITRAVKDTGTTTFSGTIRKVLNDAFSSTALRSTVLNEELERLNEDSEHHDQNGITVPCENMFGQSGLEEIVLPGTLRKIGDDALQAAPVSEQSCWRAATPPMSGSLWGRA